MKISVVIPAKNEAETIKDIIERSKKYADELLVIDGHSTDATRQVAEACGAKVILDNRKGKGAAIRLAIEKVTGDIIVFIDADGSHDPDDIPRLTYPILKDES